MAEIGGKFILALTLTYTLLQGSAAACFQYPRSEVWLRSKGSIALASFTLPMQEKSQIGSPKAMEMQYDHWKRALLLLPRMCMTTFQSTRVNTNRESIGVHFSILPSCSNTIVVAMEMSKNYVYLCRWRELLSDTVVPEVSPVW